MSNEIKCMYFDYKFKEKPQGKQCGWVQNNLTQTVITIEDLAEGLCHGASFKPAVLVGGNKAENWCQQQLFGLDFDDGTSGLQILSARTYEVTFAYDSDSGYVTAVGITPKSGD